MKKQRKVKFDLDNNTHHKVEPKSKNSIKNIEKKFNKNNMVVAVRCRPLNNKELEFSNIETVKITNREIISIIDTPNEEGEDLPKNKIREQNFAFDFAFHKYTSQEEVYTYTTQFLLQQVIDGFNATVFAYGASGAGKTYTMVGNGENPGVMVRSLSDLFTLIESNSENKKFKIKISYVEIYNETLKDLLRDDSNIEESLDLREDPNKGIALIGANEILVTNATEVFKLLM